MEMKKTNMFIGSFMLLGSIALLAFIIAWVMSISTIIDLFNGSGEQRASYVSTNPAKIIQQQGENRPTGLAETSGSTGAGSPEKEDSRQKVQKQYTGQKNNPMTTVKKAPRGTMDSDAGRKELDSMFEDFLEERGLSHEKEMAAVNGYSSSLQVSARDTHEPDTHDASPDEEEKEYSDTEKQLTESYDLEDIKLTATGELWIKLDSNDMSESAIHEMMTEAANLHHDGTGPLKVVVWQGRRPAVIKTFFGEPIF